MQLEVKPFTINPFDSDGVEYGPTHGVRLHFKADGKDEIIVPIMWTESDIRKNNPKEVSRLIQALFQNGLSVLTDMANGLY